MVGKVITKFLTSEQVDRYRLDQRPQQTVIHTDASIMNVEPVESTETGQDLDAAGSLQGAFTSLPVEVEPFQSS